MSAAEREIAALKKKLSAQLLAMRFVSAVAVGRSDDGAPALLVCLAHDTPDNRRAVRKLVPVAARSIPLVFEESGQLVAH